MMTLDKNSGKEEDGSTKSLDSEKHWREESPDFDNGTEY